MKSIIAMNENERKARYKQMDELEKVIYGDFASEKDADDAREKYDEMYSDLERQGFVGEYGDYNG